jgi:hypothetical protein
MAEETPTIPTIPTTTGDPSALALQTLLELVKNASSSEAMEAQNILLRRLALQGDVTSSRVPPPRNITEIGGYINLLTTLNEQEMRAQALAGVLGVAGPNPPLGWFPTQPPIAFLALSNDRPPGPAQPTIPLTFSNRADFAPALQVALAELHAQGALLPLYAPLLPLPPATPATTTTPDPLDYLGRVLRVMPTTALHDADTDPIALARPTGSADPFAITARSVGAGGGPAPVPSQNWDVIECTEAACAPVAVSASLVPVAPVLAAAGFYPASPLPEPTTSASTDWARFTNLTGLIPSVTTLGDELALLYRTADVQASAFADKLAWLWNGTQFAPA